MKTNDRRSNLLAYHQIMYMNKTLKNWENGLYYIDCEVKGMNPA